MKNKIIYIITLGLLFSLGTSAQEPFEKRFSISFSNETFADAITKLTQTQGEMGVSWGISSEQLNKCLPVTMDLKNVTFAEVMDTILSRQNIIKSYWILDYGGDTKDMQLNLEEKSNGMPKYVQRNKNKGKYYHVGDQLPDSLYTISNYPGKTAIRLAELKKKLVILDMWGINCGGCIAAMPGLEQLQQEFKDQVQIILVTRDSFDQVEELKKHVKIVRDCSLPFITGENVLGSLFDYAYVPDEAWLDQNGKIVYFTQSPIATGKNIRAFLSGKIVSLHELKDTSIVSDWDRPIVSTLQSIQKGDFGISAYLAPHNETKYSYHDAGGGFTSDTSRVKSIVLLGANIDLLYSCAYDNYTFSQMPIFKNYKQPYKYEPDPVNGANHYDYELIMKRHNTPRQFYRHMQLDLDDFFNLQSRREKRKIPCYILTRVSRNSLLKGSGPLDDNLLRLNDSLSAKNALWGTVVENLKSNSTKNIPMIDETGFDPKMLVTFKISTDFNHNLAAVRKSLAPYGLSVKIEEREINCVLLTDTPKEPSTIKSK